MENPLFNNCKSSGVLVPYNEMETSFKYHRITVDFMLKWIEDLNRAILTQDSKKIDGLLQKVHDYSMCRLYEHLDCTVMHYLVCKNYSLIVSYLIKLGWSVNYKNSLGDPPLTSALYERNTRMAKKLIVAGTVMDNKYYRDGYGPLHMSVGTSSSMLSIIVEAGCDLEGRSRQQFAPLHVAAMIASKGGFNRVKALVHAGSDVNAVDGVGRTCLHFAASQANVDMIQFLLKRGATVNMYDFLGSNPLGYCFDTLRLSRGFGKFQSKRNILRSAELLIEHGAHVNTPKPHRSALMVALTKNVYTVSILRFLLMHGSTFQLDHGLLKFMMVKKRVIADIILRHAALCDMPSWTGPKPINFKDRLKKKWLNFYSKCQIELEKMQNTPIYNFTLLNVLCDESARSWVVYNGVLEMFRQQVTDDQFPIYKDLLVTRFFELRQDQRLKQKAVKKLSQLMSIDSVAFPIVFDEILCYLTKDHLRTLALV